MHAGQQEGKEKATQNDSAMWIINQNQTTNSSATAAEKPVSDLPPPLLCQFWLFQFQLVWLGFKAAPPTKPVLWQTHSRLGLLLQQSSSYSPSFLSCRSSHGRNSECCGIRGGSGICIQCYRQCSGLFLDGGCLHCSVHWDVPDPSEVRIFQVNPTGPPGQFSAWALTIQWYKFSLACYRC